MGKYLGCSPYFVIYEILRKMCPREVDFHKILILRKFYNKPFLESNSAPEGRKATQIDEDLWYDNQYSIFTICTHFQPLSIFPHINVYYRSIISLPIEKITLAEFWQKIDQAIGYNL